MRISGLRDRTVFTRAFNHRPEGPGNIGGGGGLGKVRAHLDDATRLFLLATFRELTMGEEGLILTPQRKALEDLFQGALEERISVPDTFNQLFTDLRLTEYHRSLVLIFHPLIEQSAMPDVGIDFLAHLNHILSRPFIPETWPVKSQDRRLFVPAVFTDRDVSHDGPLPIGHGQTISQPSLVKLILEKAQIKPGDTVLEIGSGSGWVLAQLSHLVGEKGQVFGVERVPELRERGKEVLQKLGYTNVNYFDIEETGFPAGLTDQMVDSFDAVIISADVPLDGTGQAYIEKLAKYVKESGKIIFPANGSMKICASDGKKLIVKTLFPGVRFVPLIIDKDLQVMLRELLMPNNYSTYVNAVLSMLETLEGINILIKQILENPEQKHLHALVVNTLQFRASFFERTGDMTRANWLQAILDEMYRDSVRDYDKLTQEEIKAESEDEGFLEVYGKISEFLLEHGVLRQQEEKIFYAFKKFPRLFFLPSFYTPGNAYQSDHAFIGKENLIGFPAMLLYGIGALNIQQGQNVLEIGTGTSWLSHIMADITGNTGHVDSMDIDSALIDAAKRKAKAFGVTNINFIAGNVYIEGQKLADESFDRILLSVVVTNPDLIKLLARKLKVGGQMVLWTKDQRNPNATAINLAIKLADGSLSLLPGLSF